MNGTYRCGLYAFKYFIVPLSTLLQKNNMESDHFKSVVMMKSTRGNYPVLRGLVWETIGNLENTCLQIIVDSVTCQT